MDCCKTDCPDRQEPLPVDAVSGLRPRWPRPDIKGAVLVKRLQTQDDYWTPTGERAYKGETKHGMSDLWGDDSAAAARALSLPLRGPGPDDMKDGESAWTDERLEMKYRRQHRYTIDESPGVWLGYKPSCPVAASIGLDNLRRWKYGWICRKVAQPAPGLERAKERLIAAGATEVHDDNAFRYHVNDKVLKVNVGNDGYANLHLFGVPLDRAEAALRAATEQDLPMSHYQHVIEQQAQQLATHGREIEWLRQLAAQANRIVSLREDEIARLTKCCTEQVSQVVEAKAEVARLKSALAAGGITAKDLSDELTALARKGPQ